MASPGNGSGPHLSGELFKMMAGIDMVHVPYRGGGPAMTDLIGGQVQVTFVAPILAIEHIRTGKVRALAVTTATRSKVLPDVPTVAEFLPGYEFVGWWGIGAPKETPLEIVEQTQQGDQRHPRRSQDEGALCRDGRHDSSGTPADFGKLIADETEKRGKVVKFSGAKPD